MMVRSRDAPVTPPSCHVRPSTLVEERMQEALATWRKAAAPVLELLRRRDALLASGQTFENPEVKETDTQAWERYAESRRALVPLKDARRLPPEEIGRLLAMATDVLLHRRLDPRDVDLTHRHHRLEGAARLLEGLHPGLAVASHHLGDDRGEELVHPLVERAHRVPARPVGEERRLREAPVEELEDGEGLRHRVALVDEQGHASGRAQLEELGGLLAQVDLAGPEGNALLRQRRAHAHAVRARPGVPQLETHRVPLAITSPATGVPASASTP